MNDLTNARIRCLQSNIDRYCRLLATDLTEVERNFIHKRIAEERADLERLVSTARADMRGTPEPYIAAKYLATGGRNHFQA